MTDIILTPEHYDEISHRQRSLGGANIRLAALLVTVVLHGSVIWWGVNSARRGAPYPEKIQAIRIFLPPMALPELAAAPQPLVSSAAVKPAVLLKPLALPRVAASPSPPATLASGPAPVLVAPAALSLLEVTTVSLAPLPVAAPAVVPTPAAVVISAASASMPVASESAAAGLAATVNVSSGGGPAAGDAVANGAVAAGAGSGAAGTGKEHYLRELFGHLEARKYYPPVARRRHLEGQVRVSFTIEPGGLVSNLKASEGHPQLEEAALQTVRRALPLPIPAGGVSLPFNLSYHMDFRLR